MYVLISNTNASSSPPPEFGGAAGNADDRLSAGAGRRSL